MLKKLLAYAKYFIHTLISVLKDKKGEGDLSVFYEIGNTVYNISAYFKQKSTATLTEKLSRLMEKELEKPESICYNDDNTNSQKSLDCKPDAEISA